MYATHTRKSLGRYVAVFVKSSERRNAAQPSASSSVPNARVSTMHFIDNLLSAFSTDRGRLYLLEMFFFLNR